MPVRRRHDFVISVHSLTVQLRVTAPRNTFASHIVRFCTVGGIQSHRRTDRVIEQRVGNEAARVICLPIRGQLQRIASTRGDRAIAYELSIQLVGIQRLDISAVVLVEIGQAVVEENRWPNVIWNIEYQGADGGPVLLDSIWRNFVPFSTFQLGLVAFEDLNNDEYLSLGISVKSVFATELQSV